MVRVCRFPQVRSLVFWQYFFVANECVLGFLATRLIKEKRRIEREEDATEAELLALQQQMNEKFARLTRLRRQKKSIVSRGHEMIRKGLQSLDDLEEADRMESEAVIDVQALGGFGVLDWNAIFSDPPLLPDIAPASSGSASGST